MHFGTRSLGFGHLNSRETSLDSNPKATQIFIKYMHDIVLKISFLDINSQNWITATVAGTPLEIQTQIFELG